MVKGFTPLVSIIVPVYNCELYLRECLHSCAAQTYENIEVLCIDDASTDSSWSIVKEFCGKDKRIRSFHLQANRGLSFVRNYALDRCNGEFVLFLDSDDFLSTDAVRKCIQKIKEDKTEVVYFNNTLFDTHQSWQGYGDYPYSLLKGTVLTHETDIWVFFTNVTNAFYSNLLLKKNNIRFVENTHFEDWDFSISVLCSVDKFSYLKESLYFYRQSNSNSITKGASLHCLDIIYASRRAREHLVRSKLWDKTEYAHWCRSFNFFLWIYKTRIYGSCTKDSPKIEKAYISELRKDLLELHDVMFYSVLSSFSEQDKKLLIMMRGDDRRILIRSRIVAVCNFLHIHKDISEILRGMRLAVSEARKIASKFFKFFKLCMRLLLLPVKIRM